MQPVQGGTQGVTFRQPDPREYEAQKRAALMANKVANPAIAGIQQVMNDGIGSAIKHSRNEYGNPNIMPNELMQGADSNFAQKDSPGNRPLEDYMNQTGNLQDEVSSTMQPGQDVEDMESSALNQRLKMYAEAAGNAGVNLNRGNY